MRQTAMIRGQSGDAIGIAGAEDTVRTVVETLPWHMLSVLPVIGMLTHSETAHAQVTIPAAPAGAQFYSQATLGPVPAIDFGVTRVDAAPIVQGVTITNIGLPGGAEGLTIPQYSATTASTGQGQSLVPDTHVQGQITDLAAGTASSSDLTMTLEPRHAGTLSANVILPVYSDGSTTSGNGLTALGRVTVAATGTVLALTAVPVITTGSVVNAGPIRMGTSLAPITVGIANAAAANPLSDLLIANSVSVSGTGISASGGFGSPGGGTAAGGLPGGAGNSHAARIQINSAQAGTISGQVNIGFESDASPSAGTIPLPYYATGTIVPVAPQSIAVTGTVLRTAMPVLNTQSISLAARVGDAYPSVAISVSNPSPDAFTENAKAAAVQVPTGLLPVVLQSAVTAGATGTPFAIVLPTSTPGLISGNVVVGLSSSGVPGEQGAISDIARPNGTIAANAAVYAPAVANVTGGIDFGIVHVGQTVAPKPISITNIASGALTDSVTGALTYLANGFTEPGATALPVAGIAAGQTSQAMTIGIDTSAARRYGGGLAQVALQSHDPQLPDLSLPTANVTVTGGVNNYASIRIGGSTLGFLEGSGSRYTIDLGNVTVDSGAVAMSVAFLNAALAPADNLQVSYGSYFGDTEFSPFSVGSSLDQTLLAPGQEGVLRILLDPTQIGHFSGTLELIGSGLNASGYDSTDNIAPLYLTFEETVVPTPEPASVLTILSGLAGLIGLRRRRRS